MKNKEISATITLKAEYYDVDSMRVVWHGNYIKFYEQARCVLLDKIGYNYNEMEEQGIIWPIVKLDVKYIKPVVFGQEFSIKATLLEYENRLKIKYQVFDPNSGKTINKGNTIQMAVDLKSGNSLLVSPSHFIEKIEKIKNSEMVFA